MLVEELRREVFDVPPQRPVRLVFKCDRIGDSGALVAEYGSVRSSKDERTANTTLPTRILLLAADRCADDIQLSQESLAEMLGVRRSSVTAAAAILRGEGAIEYRRAVIKILDREKLRNMVCECYSTIRHTIDVGFNTHPPADVWA